MNTLRSCPDTLPYISKSSAREGMHELPEIVAVMTSVDTYFWHPPAGILPQILCSSLGTRPRKENTMTT
ncbi:hypothetical protein BDZ85DRAFT_265910 [Elsinoe ampelina]|uniref:Uncharacterized protein n=1 Tax=Elsinoe ampelina TaxID=302913 RepID=A0A6A6G573_9PEZI|nr:hypothetical protein BDZ85DRAFT_265910 [Elsinoe ampelina]